MDRFHWDGLTILYSAPHWRTKGLDCASMYSTLCNKKTWKYIYWIFNSKLYHQNQIDNWSRKRLIYLGLVSGVRSTNILFLEFLALLYLISTRNYENIYDRDKDCWCEWFSSLITTSIFVVQGKFLTKNDKSPYSPYLICTKKSYHQVSMRAALNNEVGGNYAHPAVILNRIDGRWRQHQKYPCPQIRFCTSL